MPRHEIPRSPSLHSDQSFTFSDVPATPTHSDQDTASLSDVTRHFEEAFFTQPTGYQNDDQASSWREGSTTHTAFLSEQSTTISENPSSWANHSLFPESQPWVYQHPLDYSSYQSDQTSLPSSLTQHFTDNLQQEAPHTMVDFLAAFSAAGPSQAPESSHAAEVRPEASSAQVQEPRTKTAELDQILRSKIRWTQKGLAYHWEDAKKKLVATKVAPELVALPGESAKKYLTRITKKLTGKSLHYYTETIESTSNRHKRRNDKIRKETGRHRDFITLENRRTGLSREVIYAREKAEWDKAKQDGTVEQLVEERRRRSKEQRNESARTTYEKRWGQQSRDQPTAP